MFAVRTELLGEQLKSMPDTLRLKAGFATQLDEWVSSSSDYKVHSFEDAHYVYCIASGDTHVLNFFTYDMLTLLDDNALSWAVLCKDIRAHFELSEDECADTLILSSLSSLDEAGLIHKIEVRL